jgi:hypothetical protein
MPLPKKFVLGGAVVLVTLVALVLVFAVGGRKRGTGSGRWDVSEMRGRTTIPPHSIISMAKLSSRAETPDNCADVTFGMSKEIDFDHLQARGFVVLKSTCQTIFSRFVPIASCTRSDLDDKLRPLAHAVAYYYDVATLEGDDTHQGQCLGTGGAWKLEPEYDLRRPTIAAAVPHHEIDSLMELMP